MRLFKPCSLFIIYMEVNIYMAGTDLGTIVAHLNLDVNQFQNGVQQAQQQLENASSGFDRVANAGKKLQGIGAGLTAAVTVPVAGIAKSAVSYTHLTLPTRDQV